MSGAYLRRPVEQSCKVRGVEMSHGADASLLGAIYNITLYSSNQKRCEGGGSRSRAAGTPRQVGNRQLGFMSTLGLEIAAFPGFTGVTEVFCMWRESAGPPGRSRSEFGDQTTELDPGRDERSQTVSRERRFVKPFRVLRQTFSG